MGPVAGENGSTKRDQEEDPKSRLSMQQEYGSKKPMSTGGTENALLHPQTARNLN